MAASVGYRVDGWGAGRVWFEDDVLLYHELPSGTGRGDAGPQNELTERFCSYFAGERPDFSGVRLDLEDYTSFQLAPPTAVCMDVPVSWLPLMNRWFTGS